MSDSNFQILVGGKTPEEIAAKKPIQNLNEVEKQIELNKDNPGFSFNWDNCMHNSHTIEEYDIRSCCSGLQKSRGVICHHLSIRGLTPVICNKCTNFKLKESK